MVSRGIASKGWETAINAFQQLKDNNAHLVLVGHSDHLHDLKKQYGSDTRIHFAGHSDNPVNMIHAFDAGLLPTTYPSESLPTVVIEYLFCHKPVIASEAGEIKNMICRDGKEAGIIIPISNDKVPADEVSTAMKRYINEAQFYNLHKGNTAFCFEQFEMDKCIDRYTEVYANAGK